jgi:acid phosphatase
VPGLENSRGNFSEYRARFASVTLGAGAASGSNSNIFYSFELGLTHYLGFSAEAYAYNSGQDLLANQLAFMKADLAAVNRTKTPWVVALVHKDWNMEAEAYQNFYPVLEAGKVDVLFCGHIHYYNRDLPYNAVTKETDSASVSGPTNNQVYSNPKYMVNIVTGASGDKEGETPCVVNILPPSVTCDVDYGYGIWTAVDANTATWNYQSVKPDFFGPPNYSDNLTIKKNAPRRGEDPEEQDSVGSTSGG